MNNLRVHSLCPSEGHMEQVKADASIKEAVVAETGPTIWLQRVHDVIL